MRFIPVLLCGLCAFAATPTVTVAELVGLTRNALAKHDTDANLAKALRKLKPAERIEYRVLRPAFLRVTTVLACEAKPVTSSL